MLKLLLKKYIHSNLCRIFRLRGDPQNVCGGPIFRGWSEILLLGKALKFGVIFQKLTLTLIKICKIIVKIREKCKFFGKFFKIFWPGIIFNYMKNKELIWTGYSGGSGGGEKNFHEICQNR